MALERWKSQLDAAQQRRPLPAFVVGVVKKFGDDRAGDLAAVVTYYAFLSIFPLLLLFVTVTGFVLHDDPGLRRDLVDSAIADFPVVGVQLRRNIGALDGNAFALLIGSVGLLWGSLGVAHAMQHAMAEIWDVPMHARPGLLPRLVRALLVLAILGTSVLAATLASAMVASTSGSPFVAIASFALTLVLNVALYAASFRVLTPRQIAWPLLWPGAIVGGASWTVLQLVGTWLVARHLREASELYGFFGIVLGLLFFLFLAARLSLYAAEVNVVRARRLYPRSLVSSTLTDADRRAYASAAEAQQRVPEEQVDVEFTGPPASGAES
jgi:YihY family inner membrane protein